MAVRASLHQVLSVVIMNIYEGRGSHFDPDAVDAFLRVEEQFKSIAGEYADEHTEGIPQIDNPSQAT